MLLDTLKLVFKQTNFYREQTCEGWKVSLTHGLILVNWISDDDKGFHKFPVALAVEQCFPIVLSWLGGQEAKKVKMEGEDSNYQHDGSNSLGWRIYCEQWGHVDGIFQAICAVKPAYMWHGK